MGPKVIISNKSINYMLDPNFEGQVLQETSLMLETFYA